MKFQDFFNKVYEYAKTMDSPAIDKKDNDGCRYLTSDGKKCLIGQFIPEQNLQEIIERSGPEANWWPIKKLLDNYSVNEIFGFSLTDWYNFSIPLYDLLDELQFQHDVASAEYIDESKNFNDKLMENLNKFAAKHDLVVTA